MPTHAPVAQEFDEKDRKTPVVALFCLLGAAAGSHFLYLDMNASGAKGVGTPMAKLEKHAAKVKRKVSTSYVWSPVQFEEPLYRKDSIQTGNQSAATIRFNDGTAVEVGEDSLIVIDDVANLSLSFLRGSVVVRSSTGDTRITKDKEGRTKVEELPVQLLSPDRMTSHFSAEGASKPIRFSWKLRSSDQRYSLQISKDRSFKPQRTQSISIDPGVAEHTAQLAPGGYYWRVVGENPSLAEARYFVIRSALALRLTYPLAQERQSIFSKESPLSFRWSLPERAESRASMAKDEEFRGDHTLEISTDPEFSRIDRSEKINPLASSALLKGVPEGTHYWRISSRYSDILMKSKSEPFIVDAAKKLAITLNSPDEKSVSELLPQFRFIWSSNSLDTEYRLDLVDAKTQKPIQGFQGRANAYLWKTPAAGLYQWRVTAHHQGEVIGESEWRTFSIVPAQKLALKSPQDNSQFRFWKDPPQIEFEWAKDPLLEQEGYSYRFELSADPAFKKKLFEKALKDGRISSSEFKLGQGLHYWRVLVVGTPDMVVKTSEALRFDYGLHPLLKPPASSRAESGEIHNYMLSRKDPVISWGEVQEAKGYEVTVFTSAAGNRSVASADGGSKILLQKTTTETQLELKDLGDGDVFWSVKAIDPVGRRGEASAAKKLTITRGAPLEAPEVTTVEVQ